METRLQLIEENFESQQSGKSDLLIHIGPESISYAIVDQGREQLKALAEYKASISELEEIVQSDRCLRYFYRRIKVAAGTFKFTFIPRDVFSEDEIGEYAKFISPASISDVLVKDIRPFRIKNVTAFDEGLQKTIAAVFKQPALFSQAEPFIEGAFKISAPTVPVQLFINLEPGRVEMAVMKEGSLLFYNLFECFSADDFNYFLLLVIDQFKLQADILVSVAGKIELDDDFYQRVKKYFNTIEFADPCGFIKCFEPFQGISLHRYFSLLSLNLCE